MTVEPSPYGVHVALDLYELMPFPSLSASAKRLLVARWVNRGLGVSDLPKLTPRDRSRFNKICDEPGFEIIQEILADSDTFKEQERLKERNAAIERARAVKYGYR